MSEKIVQLNEEVIKGQIKELVRGSVEETLNELLEKEAESLTQAARYAGMLLLLLLGGQQPRTSWEGTGIFDWPLPGDFSITSPFGERGDPFTGELSFHDGVDIAAPEGTAILTAADGVVTAANRTDPWGGSYGYYVRIRHDETYETLYAHCAEVLVRAGQEVRQGEIIALVGSTGNSTGSHLHFEVREGRDKVDAMTFFQKKPVPENTSP